MFEQGPKELTYHHSEIARLTAAIAAARPHASRTNALRSKLKYHEEHVGRPVGLARAVGDY
jgi:methionine synthase I (cobalamin-dependent)